MNAFVVDTNVPVTANGRAEQAGPPCVLACIEALSKIVQGGMTVLDDGRRILREYMDNLNMSGQPGVGDMFMKWVWQNQAVTGRCEQVTITPRDRADDDFDEFPDDPALARFHRKDRKFVAVALASRNNPLILNAVDSDWQAFRQALTKHRVRIRFLCSAEMGQGCSVENLSSDEG